MRNILIVALIVAPLAFARAQPETAQATGTSVVLVSFEATDGTALEGKLTVPAGPGGPFPVVFYIHGAGARTYDSPFMYADAEGKPQVARYLDFHGVELARRGIALFRMSKRGCTPKDGPPGMTVDRAVFSGATMTVLLDDYERALGALRARPEVDASRIVLMGSSEGTRLAPQLALRSPQGIIGVVLMAYAADNARDTIVWQNSIGPWRNIEHLIPAARDGNLTRAEFDEFAATNPARAAALAFTSLDADADGVVTSEDLVRLVRPRLDAILQAVEARDDDFLWRNLVRLSSAYLNDWWDAEPNQNILLRLDIPLAILHGELDGACRVEGVRETEEAFRAAGKTNLTVHIYPATDHDLNWTRESAADGGPEPYRDAFEFVVGLVRK